MAYEYDRVERENGGGAFLMGMLAGTVLGAGLGMLFAPKAGSEVRKQLSEQASRLRTTASDTIQQASDKFNQASQQASDKFNQASQQVSEKFNQASHQASEKLGQASEKVSQIVDRGREAYDRAKAPVADAMPTGYPTSAPTDRI
jgi:gas vesicle protein